MRDYTFPRIAKSQPISRWRCERFACPFQTDAFLLNRQRQRYATATCPQRGRPPSPASLFFFSKPLPSPSSHFVRLLDTLGPIRPCRFGRRPQLISRSNAASGHQWAGSHANITSLTLRRRAKGATLKLH
jgi:hypothetical protein